MALVLTAKQNDCIIIDGKKLEIMELQVQVSAKLRYDGGIPSVVDKVQTMALMDGMTVKLSPHEPSMSSVRLVFDAPAHVMILRQKASAKKP